MAIRQEYKSPATKNWTGNNLVISDDPSTVCIRANVSSIQPEEKRTIIIKEIKVEPGSKTQDYKGKINTNLVVPSNRGGCSAVASKDGGGISCTLQRNKNQVKKTKEEKKERGKKFSLPESKLLTVWKPWMLLECDNVGGDSIVRLWLIQWRDVYGEWEESKASSDVYKARLYKRKQNGTKGRPLDGWPLYFHIKQELENSFGPTLSLSLFYFIF